MNNPPPDLGWGAKKPPPEGDPGEAPKPKRYWWRFTLASFLIVIVSAAAVSTAVLLYIDSVAEAISKGGKGFQDPVKRQLAKVDGGEPQTFMFLGSDKRAGAEFAEDPGRSDTTMLVRLNPDTDTISVLSIPRDLKVEIPGVGTAKFNAAYEAGGPKLTLQVVKELTDLKINHVVNIDFLGFVQAVYSIGCVFTDVDRRYYHSNEGVPPSEQYAEINVKPGYQLLCGKRALEYVRYRHTDTDLVRSARQQDFISAARAQVDVDQLAEDVFFGSDSGLVETFTKYTTSDIDDSKTLLDVLKLFLSVRGASVNEVHFPAELGPSYVEASPEMIEQAVDQFLGGEASGGSRGTLEDGEENDGPGENSGGAEKKKGEKKKSKGKRQGKKKKPKKEEPLVKAEPPGSDGLVPAREAGEEEAEIAARRVNGRFPIFFPTRLPPGAYYVESNPYEKIVDPYVYRIPEELGKDAPRHQAYRMVLVVELPDGPHYFGVQGIRGWSDPPILDDPSETKEIKGREYDIYVDGDRVKLVAWHRGENSYWVSNDLLQTLTNEQMLGMARSASVIVADNRPKKKRSVAK